MMNRTEITQFAKKIIRSQKGLQNRQLMHPKREWLIGVFVAVSIFVASITWSAIEYVKGQTVDDQTVTQTEAPAAVYRETLVEEALSIYAEKTKRLDTLLGEDTPIVFTETKNEDELNTELTPDGAEATTTQNTASSSDNEAVPEPEESDPAPSPAEDAPPVPEESVQPVTNI
jgi:hypothetical protein